MPVFTSLRRMERRICPLLSNLCIRWERIANEILMHFRGQKKSATDASLSDYIETGKDGTSLSLMDVVCSDEDVFDQLSEQELIGRMSRAVQTVLEPREREILRMRYGLSGATPLTQREVAEHCGISRSYVSRIEKKALRKLREELER